MGHGQVCAKFESVFHGWPPHRSVYNADRLRRMEQTRDVILGPPGEMSDKKAKFDKKASGYIGGVTFERTHHTVEMQNGERCYGIATTF